MIPEANAININKTIVEKIRIRDNRIQGSFEEIRIPSPPWSLSVSLKRYV